MTLHEAAGEFDLLNIPGWHNSPDAHWQSQWENEAKLRRIALDDWTQTSPERWVAAVDSGVRKCQRPVVAIAHSLGGLALVHWAASTGQAHRIAAALIVAPPDVEAADALEALRAFAPVPRQALPFPARVVASENDHYAGAARVRELAGAWRADYVCAGALGHINVDSALGEWRQGQRLLGEFLDRQARVGAAWTPAFL